MTELNWKLNDQVQLLRLAAVGSVDDGKSTLIGRLLVDTKGAFEDQLLSVTRKKGAASEAEVDLALLTDGLSAEREQGITIDVAYRYFATPKRKFIMADCPGHEQYTRNMVTGSSTANAAIILIDARNGVMPQTKRHTHILSLLGTPHLLVAINKMDMVNYSQEIFEEIRADMADYCAKQGIKDLACIPISALHGDMVAVHSNSMDWYEGETLLETLESIDVTEHIERLPFRFAVQYVNRPQTDDLPDFRGYCGRINSGMVHAGDAVTILPSGKTSCIKEIVTFDGNPKRAFAPQSVTLTLTDDIDVSRGDMIVHADAIPKMSREIEAMVCWMSEEPLLLRNKYIIKQTTNSVRSVVTDIVYRTDIHTLNQEDADALGVNDIGRVRFKLAQPIYADAYAHNRATGSFVIINTFSNITVGAGMLC